MSGPGLHVCRPARILCMHMAKLGPTTYTRNDVSVEMPVAINNCMCMYATFYVFTYNDETQAALQCYNRRYKVVQMSPIPILREHYVGPNTVMSERIPETAWLNRAPLAPRAKGSIISLLYKYSRLFKCRRVHQLPHAFSA